MASQFLPHIRSSRKGKPSPGRRCPLHRNSRILVALDDGDHCTEILVDRAIVEAIEALASEMGLSVGEVLDLGLPMLAANMEMETQ